MKEFTRAWSHVVADAASVKVMLTEVVVTAASWKKVAGASGTQPSTAGNVCVEPSLNVKATDAM